MNINKYKAPEGMQSSFTIKRANQKAYPLHHTARLLNDHERTFQVLLQEIVNILPAASDQAELAAAGTA